MQLPCRGPCARGTDGSPISGPSYDLTFCEVRDTSLVLLWKAPVYSGSSPVSGYFVDYKEEGSEEWITANEVATATRYLKVSADPHRRPAGELGCQAGGPHEAAAGSYVDMPGFFPARGQPSWTALSWLGRRRPVCAPSAGGACPRAFLVQAPHCGHLVLGVPAGQHAFTHMHIWCYCR